MSKIKKSFNDRESDERREGYDTVKTGLPKERFQGEKQVLSPDEMGVSKSSIPGNEDAVSTANIAGSKAKEIKSKIKIAPETAVEELKSSQIGGVPLATSPGLRGVAGVSYASPADDTSRIPYSKGGYRPDTRYGKKRSEDLFEMDNTISEQIAPVVEDALDLREAPEAKQGYNGRKQFTQTRGKKNATFKTTYGGNTVSNGRIPQQLLNENSLDFVTTSKKLDVCGQMINKKQISATGTLVDAIDAAADYPTVTANGGNNAASAVTIGMKKANYHPKALKITVSSGRISAVSIEEEKINVAADPVSRDQANMNWQVDGNNVAKSVVKLQAELGRETSDKWSSLGYVIDEAYQYNMLLHDIEATTGAIMATAYRGAVRSMAYQRNILGKDGVNPQRNAIKMILESYGGILASDDASTFSDYSFAHMIFNKDSYRKGSVAAMIAMFDSTGKYKTKADLLGLQRSLSLHLSQADNNINPLHCKPSFIKVLDKADMFSTPTGSYNPVLPIYDTRKITLSLPLSLNVFLAGWKHPATLTDAEKKDPKRDGSTGTYANYAYKYRDQRNPYFTRVQHPIVEGLLRWLLKHEGAFATTFGDGNITIPFEFNFQCPSLLEFMLCSAAQDVAWERNVIFRDVLFAGDQSTYIWDDLQGLDKLNPLYSSQLSIKKYDEPLVLGKLAPDTMIREFWPQHMQLSDTTSGVGTNAKVQYFAPWPFNEQQFDGQYTIREGFFREESAFNMTIPSIAEKVRHEYVDVIKSMSERDIRLAMDRWVTIPLFTSKTTETATVNGATVTLYDEYTPVVASATNNDYIKMAAVRYEANSDGRLAIVYQLEDTSVENNLDQHSLYSIPRELGFIMDDYDGEAVITAAAYDSGNDAVSLTKTTLAPTNTYDGAKAYSGYAPCFLTSYRVESDSDTMQAIDRSAALTQTFYRCFACEDAATLNTKFVDKIGIVPCLSYDYAQPKTTYGLFNLNSDAVSTAALDVHITTLAHIIGSMLDRIMLPVNRFENCFTADNSKTAYDPLEAAIYFGMVGTLASDYTQDILERLDTFDQLGLDYTEDVFTKDSLLFR